MSPKTLRIIGLACCLLAALVAVLNLKRTANLGMHFMPVFLLILGVRLLTQARRRGA